MARRVTFYDAFLQSDRRRRMPPLPPITQALLLINVALFCLDLAFGHLLSQFMALWPLQSGYFMPWQVVTYAFMHGSMGHIFFNMMGLWMFGSELERIWGPRRYLQFLLASVLTAAACQLLISMLGGWLMMRYWRGQTPFKPGRGPRRF